MWAKPVTSVVRVVGLELVHLAGIDQAGDDLARVVLRHQRGRHHAVQLGRVVGRRARLAQRDVDLLHGVEIGDDVAHDLQRVLVVQGIVVGHARLARVHLGAAQFLGAHRLAGGGLHQRRAAEEDGALPAHDDRSRPTWPARRRRRPCTSPSRRRSAECRARTASPDCRRCGRSARGRETPRCAAAGWRRRCRPDRRTAAGSRGRPPGRARASSRSSGSRCRP